MPNIKVIFKKLPPFSKHFSKKQKYPQIFADTNFVDIKRLFQKRREYICIFRVIFRATHLLSLRA